MRLSTPHLVWDWNGTLLDDNDAVVAAVNQVCAEFGRASITLAEWRAVFGRPLLACYERLLDRPLSDVDWVRVDQLYHQAYRAQGESFRLAAGVPDHLHRWSVAGRTQSLLSMWFHTELIPLVERFQLSTLFTRVDGLRAAVGTSTVSGSKAEHLAAHLTALSMDPADVVLIGDVADDAHAAAHVGASCVLVTTGVAARSALEATGAPVVDSIPQALALLA